MSKNNKSYLKHILFALLFITLSNQLFAKETITIPSKIQEKVSKTAASNSSWYLRKASGSKAGKVLYGPFENKEQVIFIWLYLKTPANKSTCIARNQAFITKNPEVFYKREVAEINNQLEEYGMDMVIEHLFFNAEYPSKQIEEVTEAEDVNDVEELAITPQESGEQSISESTETESNTEAETESEIMIVEVPHEELKTEELKPVVVVQVEETQTKTEEKIVQESTPVVQETKSSEPEIDFSYLINESQTTEKSSRYTKEYLQDYAPKATIPVPVDDEDDNELVIENPDQADSNGITLLMKACENGNDWEIKNLIKAGANVNLKDKEGWTALMYACRYQQNISIVNTLLQNGASVKDKNIYNLSALMMAATYNDNPQIIKKLLTYYSVNEKEVFQTFIMVLSSNSTSEFTSLAKVSVFLDIAIPLNSFYQGKTPLMYAAYYTNSTKVLKLLLESGAQPEIRSTEGKTAFDYALENKALSHDEYFWALNLK